MRHFIQIRIRIGVYSDVEFYYNNKPNKIGDFSHYYYEQIDNSWDKYRRYRGRFVYSKQAHYYDNNNKKLWYYKGKWYFSYEEYIMAVIDGGGDYCYCIEYHYNDELNKIGDFSTYYYYDNSWYKYRRYRGGYVYSKESHYENSNGDREWYYNEVWYNSYEEYILAVIG